MKLIIIDRQEELASSTNVNMYWSYSNEADFKHWARVDRNFNRYEFILLNEDGPFVLKVDKTNEQSVLDSLEGLFG